MPTTLVSLRADALEVAEAAVATHLGDDAPDRLGALSHRELMRRAKTLVSVVVSQDSARYDDPETIASLERHARALRALQSTSGLFAGGDNVQSPPDSAFTINDVCDAVTMLRAATSESLRESQTLFEEIAVSSIDALVTGGVHTPNHRWEVTAALARLHGIVTDEGAARRLADRAEQWLAEGIDIDDAGLYSERSPNYAAHVTNPSLLAIARLLERPELRDVVERNLEATLDLIRPDGTVETVQSRRQDQGRAFSLAPYFTAYRSLAISTGRGDFAWAAEQAAARGGIDHTVLASLLLEPELSDPAPAPLAPDPLRSSFAPTVRLGAWRSAVAETVVYGGSDYPTARRIRSGLANDPTFLRLFAGDAILDSVRLSRAFFDLGPFRAGTLTRIAPDAYRLEERIGAAYYQPLAPEDRRPGGDYALADEGRFSAALDFDRRGRDEVAMSTGIDVRLLDDGVELAVDIAAPEIPWSLELAFRPGGVLEGVEEVGGDDWLLVGSEGSYRVGDDRIVFGPGGERPAPGAPLYRTGQDHAAVGGTDAASGVRVYVTGTAPTAFTLSLRVERAPRG